jgi:hypothetical protein
MNSLFKKVFLMNCLFYMVLSSRADAGKALIEKHCCRCHKADKDQLDLKSLLPDNSGLLADPEQWRRALSYLQSHEMPPTDSKSIPLEARQEMIGWLDGKIKFTYDNMPTSIFTPRVRRLNSREYANTLQDLLYLNQTPKLHLPADNSGYGFDNIAELLNLSPLLMEKYLQASQKYLDQSISDFPPSQMKRVFDPENFSVKPMRSGRVVDSKHLVWAKGTLSTEVNCNLSGDYELSLLASGHQAGDELVKVKLLVNKEILKVFEIAAKNNPETKKISVSLNKGKNLIQLAFINDYYRSKKEDRNFIFHRMILKGPAKLEAASPSERLLLSSKLTDEQLINQFLYRAYRRPPSEPEKQKYYGLYKKMRAEKLNRNQSLKTCFLAVLLSPKFLFRAETDKTDPYELSSRLSYFLWSSMPDEALFKQAKSNSLKQDKALDFQVKRMLKSPKVKRFIKDFSGQWLHVKNLDQHSVNRELFPFWTQGLKEDLEQEVYSYFEHVLKNNLPIRNFLLSDTIFLNKNLADFYGVKGKFDSKIRASQATQKRNSLLTTGAILAVNSEASRTSPVQRGKWILEEILGFAPPPPPPGIPSLEKHESEKLTIAQQMAKHREDPDCAVCHLRMDPLGLSMEHYDAVGRWRDSYGDQGIEPGGKLPDQTELKHMEDLQNYLLSQETAFQLNFIEQLMIYALGRGLEGADYKVLYQIHRETQGQGCRLQDIILALVKSPIFQRI